MSDLIEKLEREHSGIVGGSTAGRMLNCPGHYRILTAMQEQLDDAADELVGKAELLPNEHARNAAIQNAEKLRVSLNQSSSYADEGSYLHEVMEYLVENDVPYDAEALFNDKEIDRIFEERGIDEARFMDAVLPAYRMFNEFLDEILAEDGDEFMVKVETRVTFPGIKNPVRDIDGNIIGYDEDGAFGTCDVLIRTSRRTVVWDWKFGAGVPVAVSYKATVPGAPPDEEVVYGNDQLMFYARAALATHPEYFSSEGPHDGNGWPVELVICQPRVSEEIARYTAHLQELLDFELDLQDAVAEALDTSKPATMKIGKWCKFAPCVAQCPLHLNGSVAAEEVAAKLGKLKAARELTGSAIAHSVRNPEPAAKAAADAAELTYAEALATMLDLAEIAEPYFAEAHKQAHAFMEAGGVIPGRKLVPKRAAHDGWEDKKKAEAFLGRAGLPLEQRRKPMEPITPAVARTALKAKGADAKTLKLLEKYVKQGVSSGTNIAREDNPKEAVKPLATTVAELAGKLKQIGAA